MMRSHLAVRPSLPLSATSVPGPVAAPRLRFDPLAWLKLRFFAATWDCAIGGFGVANDADPLYVERFATVPQYVAAQSLSFTLAAPSSRRRGGRHHRRCRRRLPAPHHASRILVLTHPGDDPTPTPAEEAFFAKVLGHHDWSALLVLARNGGTSAQLSIASGPVRAVPLAVEVDWSKWARIVEHDPERVSRLAETWKDEYARHVRFADELLEEHAPLGMAVVPPFHRQIPSATAERPIARRRSPAAAAVVG